MEEEAQNISLVSSAQKIGEKIARNLVIIDKISSYFGLSDWTWTSGLYHPKVARYQLRHTQIN